MIKCRSCGNEYKKLSQHIALSSCDYPDIDKESMDIIVGAFMGDGTILDNSKNCQMTIGSTNVEYLEYLTNTLPNWLTNKIFLDTPKEKRPNPENTKDYYKLSLKRHPVFNGMKRTWYQDGKKSFPKTISLNPKRLRHWYVTDGNLQRRVKRARPRVYMANVLESDNPDLIEGMFEEIDIQAHHDDFGHYRINVDAAEKFFDYIGHNPVPGFEYKWP